MIRVGAAGSLAAVFILFVALSSASEDTPTGYPWTYECDETASASSSCARRLLKEGEAAVSFNFCKLTCGQYGSLWPRPSGEVSISKTVEKFDIADVEFTFSGNASTSPVVVHLVEEIQQIFTTNVVRNYPNANATSKDVGHKVAIEIGISSDDDTLSLTTDEHYCLMMSTNASTDTTNMFIKATTFFGARHGLETLSQMINYDEVDECLQILSSGHICHDTPVFAYRGIMLDSARNFISIKGLEQAIDGMAANKLNALHLHLTDTHSFPLELKSVPKMSLYGRYSKEKSYTAEEMKNLVQYAKLRGVRIIPEIDAPAHVGYGWQWGPLEDLGELVTCLGKKPWQSFCSEPPCGQINIANPNIYDVLQSAYTDFVDIFGANDLFHFGGDEVHIPCWNASEEIRDWMKTVGDKQLTKNSYLRQWSEFQKEAMNRYMIASAPQMHMKGILWTDSLTSADASLKYIDPANYVVQVWTTGTDPRIQSLLARNFSVIFSNTDAWYLDCGFSAWIGAGNNWCSPFHGWQKVYENRPYDMARDVKYHPLVLGGEAALWTEEADTQDVPMKLWPRGAALAERLWANPPTHYSDAVQRLMHHRTRMIQRGIGAEGLKPEFCQQNAGAC